MKSQSFQTDSARTTILKAVIARFEESTNPIFQALVPRFLEPAKQHEERLNTLLKENERLKALISEKTDVLRTAYPALRNKMRRFWRFLIDRQQEAGGSSELLRQFGLLDSGRRPVLTNRPRILDAARKIVAGEAVAISRGLPPMGLVTAAEIEAAIRAIDGEENTRNGLKEFYDLNLADLNRHREVVDRLIVRLRAHLRTALMDEPDNTKRQLQRRLGFTFKGESSASDGEPGEEGAFEAEPPDSTVEVKA